MSTNRPDIFYHKAKEQGWRARSAFKLLQIDEQFNILNGVTRAVDLCAAPGSWSQVLSRRLYLCENSQLRSITTRRLPDEQEEAQTSRQEDAAGVSVSTAGNRDESVKIVAVDLQPMAPLPGVIQIQGDITKYSTVQEILKHFEGTKADLVICDGAPDVTGLHCMDIYLQAQLLLGALHITYNVLKRGGNFVAKIFYGKGYGVLRKKLVMMFESVMIIKPSSSRKNSTEAFVVCLDYRPPEDFDPTQITPFLDLTNTDFSSLSGSNRIIIPFLVCEDVSAFDSDKINSLPLEEEEKEEYKTPTAGMYSFAKPGKEELEKQKEKFHESLQNFRHIQQSAELPVYFDESQAQELFADYLSKQKDDGLEIDDLECLSVFDREQPWFTAGVHGAVVPCAKPGCFQDLREQVANISKAAVFKELIKPIRLSDYVTDNVPSAKESASSGNSKVNEMPEQDTVLLAKSITDKILETCQEVSAMKYNKPIPKIFLIKIYERMGFCQGTCSTADKNDDGIHRIRVSITECEKLYNTFLKVLNEGTSDDKLKHVGTTAASTLQIDCVAPDESVDPIVNGPLWEAFKKALYTIKPELAPQARTELEKLAPGDPITLFDLCYCDGIIF